MLTHADLCNLTSISFDLATNLSVHFVSVKWASVYCFTDSLMWAHPNWLEGTCHWLLSITVVVPPIYTCTLFAKKFALHSAIHRPHQPSDLDRYTSKVTKRFVDHLSLSFTHRFEELQSEDDQGSDVYSDVDPPNWQQLVGRDVLAGLTPHEIKRQEVINGLTLFHISHRCSWDV